MENRYSLWSVTGSSSFDLVNKTAEANLEKIIRFGLYPDVYFSDNETAMNKLIEFSTSCLFKDLLKYDGIKKSSLLKDLLVLLALQPGNEVNYNEFASTLGVKGITVQKYIDLPEQRFAIFKLNSFPRNLRKELSKSSGIYFYDTGIRNALINNFNPFSLRGDIGALWENFCIAERVKSNSYAGKIADRYFWRTYNQKEIDYVEELGEKITGYEFKFSEKRNSNRRRNFLTHIMPKYIK